MKTVATEVLPNHAQWSTALTPFLDNSPNVSLSITNPLGGAVYMIDGALSTKKALAQGSGRDIHGYSAALRMALYTVELIDSTNVFDHAVAEERAVIFQYLALITQIAGDNLSVSGSNDLWNSLSPDVDVEVTEFLSSAQRLLASWVQPLRQGERDFAMMAQDWLLESSRGSSVASYYYARTYSVLAAEAIELYGHIPSGDEASQLRAMRKNSDVFYATAYLSKVLEPQGLLRLCNELVADLTGQDLHQNMQEGKSAILSLPAPTLTLIGFRQLSLLNAVIQKQDDIAQAVPQQRLVFFVKHIISQMAEGSMSKPVLSEAFKTLAVILPVIKAVYGAFWGQIVDLMVKSWSVPIEQNDTQVAPLHASLRICAALHKLAGDDPNDDLQDVWISERKPLVEGLLAVMRQLQGRVVKLLGQKMLLTVVLRRSIRRVAPTPPNTQQPIGKIDRPTVAWPRRRPH